jgi:hypothetical protein
MKAYGRPRDEATNRTRRGTSRPCPCCGRWKGRKSIRHKRIARQAFKKSHPVNGFGHVFDDQLEDFLEIEVQRDD